MTDAGALWSRRSPLRTLAAVVLVVATLGYSAWVLRPFTGSQLDPATSYVSEVYALDQPHSAIFRGVEGGSAVLVILATLLLWRTGWIRRGPAGADRAVRIARGATLGAMAFFGTGTLFDALSPLACGPTSDPACRAAELAGTVPMHHVVHTVSSSISGTAAVAAAIGLSVVASRAWHVNRMGASRAVTAIVVAVAVTATMLWTLWEITAVYLPPLVPFSTGALGWAQRAQLAAVAVWMLLMAAES